MNLSSTPRCKQRRSFLRGLTQRCKSRHLCWLSGPTGAQRSPSLAAAHTLSPPETHTFMSWWATKDIQESDTDRHTDTVQSGARRHCQEVMKQLTLGWKMSFFILFLEQEFANFNTWRHLKGQTHGTDIELAAMNAVGCVALHLLHLSQRAAALERTTTATAGSQLAQTFCERKYLPTPPAGDSLYLSFKMGNRRL